MTLNRRCSECGAGVAKRHDTWKNELLARDERGRFIEVVEIRDGHPIVRLKTFTVTVRGLGHWSCVHGCPKRNDQVTRATGAPRNEEISAPRVRDIVVLTSRGAEVRA